MPFGSNVPQTPHPARAPSGHELSEGPAHRRGTLQVLLERAHALPAADQNGSSDPYVVLTIGACGLVWDLSSPPDMRPEDAGSREVFSEGLQSYLRDGHRRFNREQLWAFGFEEQLTAQCFIEVDGFYFRPRDTKQQLRTRTHPKSCDPDWDEELCFEEISLEELLASGLSIEIFDADSWSADDFLGGTHLPLKFLNTRDGKQGIEPLWPRPTKWREIGARFSDKGGSKDGVKVEVAHPKLARLFIGSGGGRVRRMTTAHTVYSLTPQEVVGMGIEHCGKDAYCIVNGTRYCPEMKPQGTLELRIRFKEIETSLNEDIGARARRAHSIQIVERAHSPIGHAPRYSCFCSPTRLPTQVPARVLFHACVRVHLPTLPPVCFS